MHLKVEGIVPTCASVSFGLLFLGLFGCYVATAPALEPGAPAATLDLARIRPVLLVTLGWTALYYCFLQGQAAAAFWVHKVRREQASKKEHTSPRGAKSIEFAQVKYGRDHSKGGLIFTMDRTVGNMLEQTPPFLLSIWLHAIIGSPATAARFGWIWLLLRACYPVAFAHPSMSPGLWDAQRQLGISWVNFVTWPSYAIVWALLVSVALETW